MPRYTVHVLTKDRRRWPPAIELTFADDRDAIQQAGELTADRDVEIWEWPRFVANVMPPSK